MTNRHRNHVLLLAASAAVAILSSAGLSSTASAGECPAGKTGVDVMKPGATAPNRVTDTVIASIDLGKQTPGLDGRQFRMRRLVIEPGGVVPWHSHGDRPANIYVVEGMVTEYRSSCSVPILHKAGEVTPEYGNLSHWWKNNGSKPAVLISADIVMDDMKDAQM